MSSRVPARQLLERLHTRNEFYIASVRSQNLIRTARQLNRRIAGAASAAVLEVQASIYSRALSRAIQIDRRSHAFRP